MSPFDLAKQKMNNDEVFYEAIDFCMNQTDGVVISTKEVFVIGYPTYSSWVLKKEIKELDILDSWYIWLLAGNATPLFSLVQPKKYITFERFDNKYRLYKWDDIIRRYNG